jgi:DNA helicase-2/ATP-dependent DNA helicase PcrA
MAPGGASTRSSHPLSTFGGVTLAGPDEELLADLTPTQRQAVLCAASTVCILAGAGAGKTRVLTRRIAHLVASGQAQPEHILTLTFTRKAASELGGRLGMLGLREHVTAGTFHAVATAQLRRWWADQGRSVPTLLESPSRLVAEIAADRPSLRGVAVPELTSQLAWAKARLLTPETYEATVGAEQRPTPVAPAEIGALLARYEHEKRRRGLVDFDDLLSRCADAMAEDRRFAAAQHWRWRWVFVDEFQDVNPLQHRLLLAWLGPDTRLCVVGDPNQAIYGWNGADPRLLDEVARHRPGTEVIRLDDNHRCSPQVVAAGAAVLGAAGADLRSRRPDGPRPEVLAYPSEEAEAAGVAAGLQRAHLEGHAWSRLAVLVRTNGQSAPIRRALEAAGIPCRSPGPGGLLTDPTTVAVLDDLRRTLVAPVAVAVADLGEAARESRRMDVGSPAVASLEAVAELARDFARMDDLATVGAFLAWLPTAAGRETGGSGPAESVTVSSFHRAKGLEWHAVWICGLERGLMPISQATSPAAEAEERRLLYVALTRAEREVHCSWATHRTFGGRSVPREPSPWLAAISDEVPGAPIAAPIDVATWRERVAEQRRQLRAGSPTDHRRPGGRGRDRLPAPDPEVRARLRSWRTEGARAAGVPAHVLLHDRTLDALATLRPTTTDELLAVPGLGPVHAARFGPALLALVADHPASA